MFASDIRKLRSTKLSCFSARRDGKTLPALKSAIVDERGQTSHLTLFTPEEAVRALRSLVLVCHRTTTSRFRSSILVLATTELFRLQVLC